MSASEATRKAAADHLADLIASRESSITDIMDKMNAFRIEVDNKPDPTLKSKARNYIGIWKEDEAGTHYVRDKLSMPEWMKWADHNSIQISTNKQRILFTGESVGRGSFFGNEYSPAVILEHILTRASGGNLFEITDLAKSGMAPGELLSLLENAVALKPSRVVIMAGNNFFYGLYDIFISTQLAEPLTAGELSGRWLKERLDEALEKMVDELLRKLSRLFVTRGIPVLMAIPAFNLGGWKVTSDEKRTPAISCADVRRWEQLWETIREAQLGGDDHTLNEAAGQLISLDAAHPAAYELLGEVALSQQRWTEARQYLETARDHTLLFRSIGRPRILTPVRNTILQRAPSYDIDVIDLNKLLADHSENGIPGHDLFMDYCHMNMEGTRLCMTAIAQAIICHKQQKEPIQEMLYRFANEIVPPPETSCMAHINAAIHNAHNGQGYANIEFHLKMAFSFSEQLATSFCKSYINMAAFRLPSPLTSGFMEILENAITCIEYYPEAAFHPRDGKLLDLVLTDAMSKILVTAGELEPGTTNALRLSNHAIELDRTVNLLEPFYSRGSYDTYPLPCNYYAARDTRSSFIFFSYASQSLLGKIIYRCNYVADGSLHLFINGRLLATHALLRQWTPLSFIVDRELLVEGINRIEIAWEHKSVASTDYVAHSIGDAVELLNPVRAEIHSFTISI